MHKIARYACPELNLAFRATSRTFRRLLDPRIFHHLVAVDSRLQSVNGWLPGKPWSKWNETERQEQIDVWASRLRYVRILDYPTATEGWGYWGNDMVNLQMVRGARYIADSLGSGDSISPRTIPTMVDAVHLCHEPPAPLPSGYCTKHVINICFDPYRPYHPRHEIVTASDVPTRDFVFMFTPHYCSRAKGQVPRAHNVHCSILGDVLRAMWCQGDIGSITFVGLGELDRRLLGLPEATTDDDVHDAVRKAFGTIAFQQPMTHLTDLDKFLSTVTFMSKAAYRMSVGDQQYALEAAVEGPTELPQPLILDHGAYPHILDWVIEAAPWNSLVKLRATCRAIKARVDPVLFSHVSVLPGSLPYLVFVRGLGGRLPGVSSFDAALASDRLVHDSVRPLFQHTTVLEIPSELEIGALVRNLLPNLQVVRNLSPRPPTCLMNSPSEVIYSPLQYLARLGYTRFVAGGADSSTKLVINHLYDLNYPVAPQLPTVGLARKQPGQIVLVFSPFMFQQRPALRPSPLVANQFLDDVSTYIVNAVARRRVGRESAELTLVGVGEMAAAYVSAKPNEARHHLLDAEAMADGRLASALLLEAWDKRGHEWRITEPGETEDNLRFATLEEYLREGGDRAVWETEVPSLEAMYAAGWVRA